MKTLIIGGGLSGLALADMLETAGWDYVLVDARDRLGGRIMTEQRADGYYDMGPAWFWPGQPRIAAMMKRLGLSKFDQFATGELMFEDEHGRVQRGVGFASMEGSWRMVGGLGRLIEALADCLPKDLVRLGARVTHVTQDGRCHATLSDGSLIEADRIVLAMPPRIAAGLTFTPALPAASFETMTAVPTWMAGQSKAVAIYDAPFWREAGLSGDAMSRRGPMVEIHDASPAEGGPYALFGFIGVPPRARADEHALRDALLTQLGRLFGDQAAHPRELLLKDWAFDPLTAVEADATPQYSHPTYGLPMALRDLWDGQLIMAGTEVAQGFGGYLEGALEAADAAMEQLKASR